MIGNVGGSAGDGGFQFQAKIIAFVAVHILAETALAGLEESLEKNPLAVAAETSGPGDDIRIEFAHSINDVELQAKKGLHVDTRFDEAISKIASGLTRNTTSKVILAVNPRTGDRIKNKLSHDLDLLRQKREDALRDPNLFNRVLNIFTHFAKDEVQARELLKRLFIHTFDVEENCSRDTQTALNLLRFRVLAEEEQAAAVWSVLVQAGHTLIESRGRFDSFDFVRLLQNHNIRLSELLLPVATDRYRVWLSEKSSTFRLPGPHLGLSLPIDTAWTNLHVLSKQSEATQYDVEAQLARYHEWEQLASRDDEYYKSLDTAEIDYRVIIVGSPGSGKSTLCRKLAHDLTTFEETVMWVHLPSVVNRIQNGMNIHAALIDTAIDGFDAPLTVREALFAQADCLIADGLDECGTFVVKIAEALHNWANAHNTTRIIITTRSVGQETTFFENWSHYDLLPLTKAQVKCSAQQIITALVHDSMIASERVEQFHKQLEGNHIASLAARSPLLLGFLIQLSIEDVSLAQQRANLYEQVLNLWSTSLPQGRDWQIIQPDEAVVWRFFELFGWFLFSPRKEQLTHQQLMWKVSQELAREMDIQSLQASTVASRCLLFWHERGVLDRLQIGRMVIYTFVHETFTEYAAGRYLASLSDLALRLWVRENYTDIRWQEPILLAAGSGVAKIIVETLLTVDKGGEKTLSSLMLAASALAQAPAPPDMLAGIVAERLVACLVSATPSIVYKAAEQGSSLAARTPMLFAPLLQPLFQHSQIWTRLSALYLALAASDTIVTIDSLETFFNDLITDPIFNKRGGAVFTPSWGIQNKVVVLGAEALARICPDARTKGLIQKIYDSKQGISAGTHIKLRSVLLTLGCTRFIQEREREHLDYILSQHAITYHADQNILETILRLTSPPSTRAIKRSKLKALTILLNTLYTSETAVIHWDILSSLDDVKAIEAVLSGYIMVLQLNKDELAQDASWALTELRRIHQHGVIPYSLSSLLPNFPINKELHEPASLDMPVQDLFRALEHPSAIIVYGAAQLLSLMRKGKEEMAFLLLTSTNEQLLSVIACVATRLWGIEARPLFIKRLEQRYSKECYWLLEELPYLPGDHADQQFQQVLLNALKTDAPLIAIAAVHALQELENSLLSSMKADIQSALLHWEEKGEGKKVHRFYMADDCPACHTASGDAYAHVHQLLDYL